MDHGALIVRAFSAKSISSRGFGRGDRVMPFWNQEDEAKNAGKGILISAHGLKEWEEGRPKFSNF